MKRRTFIGLGVAAALPQLLRAGEPVKKKRLAYIGFSKVEDLRIGREEQAAVFFEELQRSGFVEADNLIVDRWQYQSGRLDEIAREVVGTKPDAIACLGSPMAGRLKVATTTIPIVAITGDPIRFGLVASLAHPGGNVTGVSVDAGVEVWAKRLELLSSAVPKLRNVVFVSSEGGWKAAGGRVVLDAAQKLGISLAPATLSPPFGEAEFRNTFSSLQRDQLDGLILSDEGQVHFPRLPLLIQLIQQLRLPAIYPYTAFAQGGGLMSYGSDVNSNFRRQAAQVAEIFRGANPGDIPYSQAVRFDLVVNLKTAKELGIEMPASLVAGATTIIE